MWRYFNTGDQIWQEWRHDKWEVIAVEAHDGVVWKEGQGLSKLSGLDLFFHRITTAYLKLVWKAFQAG